MALATSVRNVKIRNNTIDLGFSSTGSAVANYTYDSNMSLGADAIINENTFSGTIGNALGATNLTSISSGSSIITNNNFIRGTGSSITSYIAITSTTDQIIKDNIFDQSTTNGTVENLVSGLSARSIYQSNKNQISYATIAISSGLFTSDTTAGDIANDASGSITAQFSHLSVYINTLVARTFYTTLNLNNALPQAVRILSTKAGIYNINIGSAALTSGSYSLTLQVQDVVTANYVTGTNSILDSKNNEPIVPENISTSIDLATNIAALQAATQYLTLDTSTGSDPDNFINYKDKCITLFVYMTNDLSVLGGGMDYVLSPIVIKYIW